VVELTNRAFLHQSPQTLTRRVVPIFEVQKVHDAGVTGEVVHLLRLAGVAAERLVAHNGVAGLDGGADVVEVQERRRVHGHQVDVRPRAEGGDRACVPR